MKEWLRHRFRLIGILFTFAIIVRPGVTKLPEPEDVDLSRLHDVCVNLRMISS
jgi:hypothetical protein